MNNFFLFLNSFGWWFYLPQRETLLRWWYRRAASVVPTPHQMPEILHLHERYLPAWADVPGRSCLRSRHQSLHRRRADRLPTGGIDVVRVGRNLFRGELDFWFICLFPKLTFEKKYTVFFYKKKLVIYLIMIETFNSSDLDMFSTILQIEEF